MSIAKLKEQVFLLDYPKSRIFSIFGPDAERYLHNRLTQDIKKLAVGDAVESFVLTPNGRVQGSFTVLKRAGDYLLITDELESEELAEEMKAAILQFKVADQLELKDVSNDYARLSLVGDPVFQQAQKLGLASAELKAGAFEERELIGITVIILKRALKTTNCFEIIAPIMSVLPLKVAAVAGGVVQAEPLLKEELRIVEGKGKFGVDYTSKTLAPECDYEPFISFKKGCYPGQEVVEMAIARGRPNRKFLRLKIEGQAAAGEEIIAGDRAVGVLTSVVTEESESIGLAMVKTEALDEGVVFRTSSGVRIYPDPYVAPSTLAS
jgi:folate-binding protein YgfZ